MVLRPFGYDIRTVEPTELVLLLSCIVLGTSCLRAHRVPLKRSPGRSPSVACRDTTIAKKVAAASFSFAGRFSFLVPLHPNAIGLEWRREFITFVLYIVWFLACYLQQLLLFCKQYNLMRKFLFLVLQDLLVLIRPRMELLFSHIHVVPSDSSSSSGRVPISQSPIPVPFYRESYGSLSLF